ncbi:FAD-dependent oxidoreductase [Synechococcales cyanobacterium C]|uniref:FAD-dependent oxidoreductase n=1 Tax=Petrachloros mirabilis ULC683 TaxID=2781853 RepID=A0A8K1ZZG4_9CYAN|nr:FAD-dependent oxidoreductase [Petrachloros mirabilis]NCJ06818.1 FAD-dependent oxidoreductase [Petrachloros mirabilis ULC683]
MIDYDLVVLGAGSVACWAAATAARWQARVAQVPTMELDSPLELLLPLRSAAQTLHQMQALKPLWANPFPLSLNGKKLSRWATSVTVHETPTVAELSSLGVDWVTGDAQFVSKPKLSLRVGKRELRSRRYLLIFDPIPPVATTLDVPVLNLGQLIERCQSSQPPQAIGILGDGPLSLQAAQTFARLGHPVTLLLSQERSLVAEEAEAAFWVQAQLEAEGIQILPQAEITTTTSLSSSQYQICTATHTFVADVLLEAREAVPRRSLPLNLESLALRKSPQGLWVNHHLQTSHRQIYASGAILGGYTNPDLSRYEASLALKNALLWSRRPVDYHHQPRVVWTDPELARVGFTELQAQARYAHVRSLSWSGTPLPQGIVSDPPLRFCKLIVLPRGELIGAHLVGSGAPELIHSLAFACQRRYRLQDLSQLIPLHRAQSQILTALLPQQTPISPSWLERFFNLCRDWHLS